LRRGLGGFRGRQAFLTRLRDFLQRDGPGGIQGGWMATGLRQRGGAYRRKRKQRGGAESLFKR